jgi:hypothetical protein
MSETSRLRPLSWLTALVLALLGSLQACDCGSTGADVRRFACTEDDECASGFVCRLGECQPEEEPDGGVPDGGEPDGGGTDGGPDAGPPDGGPTDSNKLAVVTAPLTVQAGRCSTGVVVESQDPLGNAINAGARTTINLTAAPSTGFRFFSDALCIFPITSLTLTANRSRVTFYVQGQTGGTFSISASAPGFSTASQSETILPAVRTGTCTLPTGGDSVTCSISPPQLDLTKTLLFFQASSNDSAPDSASVRCSLSALNAVTCTRNSGNGASDPAVRIQWQTAELVSGINVQHLEAECEGTPLIELPIQPVSSLRSAFLLVSSEKNGITQGDDDYYAASLFQGDGEFHVDLEFSVDCVASWRASVQVVELEGADVTRGLTGSMTGNQLVVSNLPAVDLASTMLLFTYRTSDATGPAMCDRVLRGELTSPTSITFSRGAGAAGCTAATIDSISWERIEFSGGVSAQHLLVSMDAGVQTTTVPITAVDTTRTLVFATGQMQSGQAGGETSYAGDDVIGASLGWHALTSPTTLEVTRGFDGGVARWNSTVLQIDP